MIILGLTGSIGMGKSTVAEMFRQLGVPVHDSDAAVHELYSGAAVPVIEAAFPGTIVNGTVDRRLLSARVLSDKAALRQLENIIHPLVAEHRNKFIETHRQRGTPCVVLDIPLLFEAGQRASVDHTVVVSAAPDVQRERVLARPGMTVERFEKILGNQMSDEAKRHMADHVIATDVPIKETRQRVEQVLAACCASNPRGNHA